MLTTFPFFRFFFLIFLSFFSSVLTVTGFIVCRFDLMYSQKCDIQMYRKYFKKKKYFGHQMQKNYHLMDEDGRIEDERFHRIGI